MPWYNPSTVIGTAGEICLPGVVKARTVIMRDTRINMNLRPGKNQAGGRDAFKKTRINRPVSTPRERKLALRQTKDRSASDKSFKRTSMA
jgi:hypothetical protein